MKIVFGSDIHGSLAGGRKLIEAALHEGADKLILLGDLYYHGPRNPLPNEYSPKELAEALNANKDIIRCVKGNCDSEVDEMISEFSFEPQILLDYGDKKLFLTHGHIYDKNNPPPLPFDIMLYGHFHIGFIEKKDGKIYASPGSVSLPKGGSSASYLLLENDTLTLKTLDGEVIEEVKLSF